MQITDYIPYGKDHAISRAELARITGLKDREVRKAIKRELGRGTVILSSAAARGYWRTDDTAEIEAFIRESDHRRMTEAKTVESLRRLLASRQGVSVVPVRAHYRRLVKHDDPKPAKQIAGQMTLGGDG